MEVTGELRDPDWSNPHHNLPTIEGQQEDPSADPLHVNIHDTGGGGDNHPVPVGYALESNPFNLCDNPCRTGCITFAMAACFGTLSITMFVNQMASLVVVFCKVSCLISMLMAWYWISAKETSREATDAMFLAGLKTVALGCCSWSHSLRSWAEA